MSQEYISLKEAGEILGVSRTKIWLLVKEGTLKTYDNPIDKRKSFVLRADVEQLKQPRSTQG